MSMDNLNHCWEKFCMEVFLGVYIHGNDRMLCLNFISMSLKFLLKTSPFWETMSDNLHSDIQTEIRNTLHFYQIIPSTCTPDICEFCPLLDSLLIMNGNDTGVLGKITFWKIYAIHLQGSMFFQADTTVGLSIQMLQTNLCLWSCHYILDSKQPPYRRSHTGFLCLLLSEVSWEFRHWRRFKE